MESAGDGVTGLWVMTHNPYCGNSLSSCIRSITAPEWSKLYTQERNSFAKKALINMNGL